MIFILAKYLQTPFQFSLKGATEQAGGARWREGGHTARPVCILQEDPGAWRQKEEGVRQPC